MIATLFGQLGTRIFAGLSIVLLLALGVQTWRANHHKDKAEACELARENDRLNYANAAHQAEARAIAAKQATEARYRAEAEKTDVTYQTALAGAQRASDAYARRMRAKAPGGSPGTAPPPADDNGPESPDSAGQDAVVVNRDDFDILVENSVRLKAAHEWAKTLTQGPLPEVEFGTKPNPAH